MVKFSHWVMALWLACASTFLSAEDSKRAVHSFDVFDTLVGRLHKESRSVFDLVESRYPFPGFAMKRMQAESFSDGTLAGIYHNFASLTGISMEEAQKLRDFEMKTELSNVFPIVCNMSQIQDGDILVSDTYYDANEILKIVRHAGLDKKVEIFATAGGKWGGWIWPGIQGRYNILQHLGDNRNSDVASPRKYGIQAKWFDQSDYSAFEKKVFNIGQKELASLMRVLRLSNPFPQASDAYKVWDEQAQMNIPILIWASFAIDDFCKKNGKQKVLFATPSACHLIKIFKQLFPRDAAEDYYTSRDLLTYPTQDYLQYVRSIYASDSVIVNIQGDSRRNIEFFEKYFSQSPSCLSLLGFVQKSNGKQGQKKSVDLNYLTLMSCNIGALNLSCTGSFIGYNALGPIYGPMRCDRRLVEAASFCVQKCLNVIDEYHFGEFNQPLIDLLIKNLSKQKPVLSEYVCGSNQLQQ